MLLTTNCFFWPPTEVKVEYRNGLPQLYIPLPSRREVCQFTLRPITNTVSDLLRGIQTEDQGVDRCAVYSTGTSQ